MNALQDRIDTRIPGIALVASAILAVAAMAHHPTGSGGGDFATFARNIDRGAAVNQTVHGTMIVLVAVLTWTLLAFAARRGLHRPLVMAGLVAWAIGAVVMIIPPAFNGFVIVEIARRALASPETADTLRVTLQTLSSGVGVIVMIGAIGMSVAVFLWSADLARDTGPARWTGVLGLVAGAGLVIALPTGIGRLDLTGMTLVLGVWAVWFLAVGTLMILRRV
ncbi:MAG TPA: hypothetical protein VIK50_12985 [Gemmatimonadaceae bacterium]